MNRSEVKSINSLLRKLTFDDLRDWAGESAQARYIHIFDMPLDGKFDVSNELPIEFVGFREIVFAQGARLGDSK
jgi:hypothetical protein